MNKKIIQDFELSLFKGKGKLCSVFSEPNDNSIICNICHCNDTALWYKCHYAKGYKEYNDIPPKEWVNIIFDNMETKEVKIEIPEGYKIDKENSTFECIKFKKKEVSWRSTETNDSNYINKMSGYTIDVGSSLLEIKNWLHTKFNRFLFATEKQAKSALAMAQISQIMANDERFGGVVTDEEWKNQTITKYIIERFNGVITTDERTKSYYFLAFHTKEQRYLFLEENEDLVKDYLMID